MQRHSLDPVSLVAGLLFAGLSITLLAGRVTAGNRHLALVWAAGAVLLGVGLLASGRHSHRQGIETEPETAHESKIRHGTTEEIGED